jgi:hypothetical protein
MDEALAEPLHDMSGEHRIAAELARARDEDDDDAKRFSDPSLVVEAEARRARGKPPGSSTLEIDDDDVVAIEPDPSRRR